jgi:dTDP-4-amino-4,6-dideoxygalactose transaminase
MIPVFRPLLGDAEMNASRSVLEVGWLGMGKNVGQFEEAVSAYLGLTDRTCVAVSTGHAALHLALLLMGVGPGDEVITPSFNNAADFQAILACGASPVFCDIDDDTLSLDLDDVERLITPRTKVVIVMDYDCILCDHDRVADLAQRHGVRILHDAAHSFGSKHRGRMVGSFSDVTMFSFDPVKTVTCLDGGMLVVKTSDEVARLHEMRLVGMGQPASVMYTNARAWTYDMKMLGFRYHMSNMHAAIGLAQLQRIESIASSRRETCRFYNRELRGIPELRLPNTDFTDIVPFLYYVRVPAAMRDDFRAFLIGRGIDIGIHWQPGHWFTLLKECRRSDLSVTDRVGQEILSLPLHSCMAPEDMNAVVATIREYFQHR